MSMRPGSWQIILADLSLILFMTTLASLDQIAPGEASAPVEHVPAPEHAVWRAAPGSMELPDWLALEARDPRLRLTLHLRYPAGGQAIVWQRAEAMAAEARSSGIEPRIVLEQGRMAEAWASLAYDDAGAAAGQVNQAQTTRSRPISLAR